MAYYTEEELKQIGFAKIGVNVSVSTLAQIYKPHLIELGSYVRIDDFCILSNKIKIGNFVHVAARTLIDGGEKGVIFHDYSGTAYNCIIIASSDSYTLEGYVGPFCLPEFRKNITNKPIIINKYSVIGSFCTIMPGVIVAEGCTFCAYSFVLKDTEPWHMYMGIPARKIKKNSKGIIESAKLNTVEMLRKHGDISYK